jgi:hypothetical protein
LSRAGETPCSHVLDLAKHHLAAVDERIRQLTRFRAILANEVQKWDGVKQPTCGGLCQIIAGADEDVTAQAQVQMHMRPRKLKDGKKKHEAADRINPARK